MVSKEEWKLDTMWFEAVDDAIKGCRTCPAYVVNMEDPTCSEITAFLFGNVEGLIINAS